MTYMPIEALPATGLDTVTATDSHGETVLGGVHGLFVTPLGCWRRTRIRAGNDISPPVINPLARVWWNTPGVISAHVPWKALGSAGRERPSN